MAIMYKDGNTMRKIAKVMYLDTATNTIKTMTSCKGLVDGVVREFLPQQSPMGTWEIRDCADYTYGYAFGAVSNAEIYFVTFNGGYTYKYIVATNNFIRYNSGYSVGGVQSFFYNNIWYHAKGTSWPHLTGVNKSISTVWENAWGYDLPTPRRNIGLAAYNDTFYLAGGTSSTGNSSRLDTIKLSDKTTWVQKADMPQARMNLKLQECGGNIYGFGGGVNTVLKYNISADTWTEVSTLPNNSTSCRFCWCNEDKIYIVVDSNVYLFNPLNNTWGNVATLPETIKDIQLIVGENNKMYCMGGVDVVSNASKIAILTV